MMIIISTEHPIGVLVMKEVNQLTQLIDSFGYFKLIYLVVFCILDTAMEAVAKDFYIVYTYS